MGVFLARFFWDPCKNEWEETGFCGNFNNFWDIWAKGSPNSASV